MSIRSGEILLCIRTVQYFFFPDLPSPVFRSLGSQQPLSRHLNHPPKLKYPRGSMTGTEEKLGNQVLSYALNWFSDWVGTFHLQGGGGIVEKAFALPLVNATYDSLASLSTPLQVSLFLELELPPASAAICGEGCCNDVLHGRVVRRGQSWCSR